MSLGDRREEIFHGRRILNPASTDRYLRRFTHWGEVNLSQEGARPVQRAAQAVHRAPFESTNSSWRLTVDYGVASLIRKKPLGCAAMMLLMSKVASGPVAFTLPTTVQVGTARFSLFSIWY